MEQKKDSQPCGCPWCTGSCLPAAASAGSPQEQAPGGQGQTGAGSQHCGCPETNSPLCFTELDQGQSQAAEPQCLPAARRDLGKEGNPSRPQGKAGSSQGLTTLLGLHRGNAQAPGQQSTFLLLSPHPRLFRANPHFPFHFLPPGPYLIHLLKQSQVI